MIWLYLIVAVIIALGIAKDLSRQETWMIGIGKSVRKEHPRNYWLTIGLRVLMLLAIVLAAYLRGSVP